MCDGYPQNAASVLRQPVPVKPVPNGAVLHKHEVAVARGMDAAEHWVEVIISGADHNGSTGSLPRGVDPKCVVGARDCHRPPRATRHAAQ